MLSFVMHPECSFINRSFFQVCEIYCVFKTGCHGVLISMAASDPLAFNVAVPNGYFVLITSLLIEGVYLPTQVAPAFLADCSSE